MTIEEARPLVYENESLSKLIGLCRAIISVSCFLVRVASAYGFAPKPRAEPEVSGLH